MLISQKNFQFSLIFACYIAFSPILFSNNRPQNAGLPIRVKDETELPDITTDHQLLLSADHNETQHAQRLSMEMCKNMENYRVVNISYQAANLL